MLAVLAWGWVSFRQLPQQEDPTFPTHDAILVTVLPGAPADVVEREVTIPLEESLAKVPTLEVMRSQSHANVSSIFLKIAADRKPVIDGHWETTLGLLKTVKLPSGCSEPRLETDFQLPAALLFAVHGNDRAAVETAADAIAADLAKAERSGRLRQFGTSPRPCSRSRISPRPGTPSTFSTAATVDRSRRRSASSSPWR